ncbi:MULTISPECIES: LysR family transcriptional regulator [Burkholderiaceae]|uniref:Transcriptional regulator, LysR family n=1 Tax=Caballeronia sordidicola TaxID=196367 RepID=A0A242M8W2_CABSO|nr:MULTISPECIES: LysR family transcriptional regulator [Burkholderiaceae]AME28334.1 LysR family transcriptional regulator [Burkholderia sp. PAMC 26561]OTP67707.1 Transcriptional regulator, LysR family [Caballeronia sordidicola]
MRGNLGLNERRLRYFYETVSRGSLRAAADFLDVEPSVVSRQIQQLEIELACKLLERRGRGVVPTESAALVLDHCRERRASEETLLARLAELKGLQRGEIRIVAGEGFLEELGTVLRGEFCQKYPKINVTLEQVSGHEVVRMVSDDEAHIGIAYCAPQDSTIRVLKTRKQPVCLIAWPGHPLALHSGPLSLRDVLPYQVALMSESFGLRKLVGAAEFAEKIEFVPILTTNSLAMLKNHVQARLGVTFMSARAVANEVAAGELVALPVENAIFKSAEIQLIVRADRIFSAALQRLHRVLQEMSFFRNE